MGTERTVHGLMVKTLEETLKKLVGHKISLLYTQHEEGTLRETSGVLLSLNANIIHLQFYNRYGEEDGECYINRHACILHSVEDKGRKK